MDESQKTKAQLIEEITMLRDALDAISDGFIVFDADDRVGAFNARYQELFPSFADVLDNGVPYRTLLKAQAGRGQIEAGKGRVDERVEDWVKQHQIADGSPREQVFADGRTIRLSEHRLPSGGIVSVRTDITDLKATQRQLQESADRFKDFAQASADWYWEMDADLRYTNLSTSVVDGVGVKIPDFYGRTQWEMLGEEFEQQESLRFIRDCMKACQSYRDVVFWRTHATTGERTWIRASGMPFYDGHGIFAGFRGSSTDITETRRAEDALRESEHRFRDFARAASDWFWEMDADLPFTYLSDRYYEITGSVPEDRIGTTRTQFIDAGALAADGEKWRIHFSDLRARKPFKNLEYAFEATAGEIRHFRISGTPVFLANGNFAGYRGIGTDITEGKAIEEQLRQSQKMEAVGQLTGGVAHDFNNLLAVIMGSLELLLDGSQIDATVSTLANRALAATQRGARLTHRLLAFSRKQSLQPVSTDLTQLITGMQDLLVHSLGAAIEIKLVGAAGLWQCDVDRVQLENAILNLSLNARDAMPQGGRLTIETSNARLDDTYAAAFEDVTPGQYVLLAVSDTGTGMASDVISRAFDPFFTTKEVGKGTGLGLSMIYGFVKQSAGHVRIYSELGEGTAMKIYLPRAKDDAENSANADVGVIADTSARDEVVLVVEDDAEVRTVAVTMLDELGYEVLEAGTAGEALEHIGQNKAIGLLLTDVILPGGMGGRQLAAEACEQSPALKVLYMSGYTEDSIMRHGRLDADVQLLVKPFRRADLALKVRQTLDGAS